MTQGSFQGEEIKNKQKKNTNNNNNKKQANKKNNNNKNTPTDIQNRLKYKAWKESQLVQFLVVRTLVSYSCSDFRPIARILWRGPGLHGCLIISVHAQECKTRGSGGMPPRKFSEITFSEIASEAILGQKQSRSSYMVVVIKMIAYIHGVLILCGCLLSQFYSNGLCSCTIKD